MSQSRGWHHAYQCAFCLFWVNGFQGAYNCTPVVLRISFKKQLAVSQTQGILKAKQARVCKLSRADCSQKLGKALQLHLVRSLGESSEFATCLKVCAITSGHVKAEASFQGVHVYSVVCKSCKHALCHVREHSSCSGGSKLGWCFAACRKAPVHMSRVCIDLCKSPAYICSRQCA